MLSFLGVGIRDRFTDGVVSLVDRLQDSDELHGVDREFLRREIAARKKLREKTGNPKPEENKRAKVCGAGDRQYKKREAWAEQRASRIHERRAKKASEKKRAQDEAFRNMAEKARRETSQVPPSSGPRQSRGGGGRSARNWKAPSFGKDDLSAHYKTLGVKASDDAATIKKAYRTLMRKYHPDLHSDPKKKKAATELTVKISAAYAAIEKARK